MNKFIFLYMKFLLISNIFFDPSSFLNFEISLYLILYNSSYYVSLSDVM